MNIDNFIMYIISFSFILQWYAVMYNTNFYLQDDMDV